MKDASLYQFRMSGALDSNTKTPMGFSRRRFCIAIKTLSDKMQIIQLIFGSQKAYFRFSLYENDDKSGN